MSPTIRYRTAGRRHLKLCLSSSVVQHQTLLSEQKNLLVQFHLESSYLSLTYYDYRPAKQHVRSAQQLSGLTVNMTGTGAGRTGSDLVGGRTWSRRLIGVFCPSRCSGETDPVPAEERGSAHPGGEEGPGPTGPNGPTGKSHLHPPGLPAQGTEPSEPPEPLNL